MTAIDERPTKFPEAPPDKTHPVTAHRPVLFPWATDFGMGIHVDMTAAGYLLRAAREDCEKCMRHWASKMIETPYAVVHLLGSSWTRCIEYGIRAQEVYQSDSAAILKPMVAGDLKKMLKIAAATPPPRLYGVLNDALSILIVSHSDLLAEADRQAG